MDSYIVEVQQLLAEAERLPMSPGRLALVEQAVRIADAHNDVDLGIAARRPLMYVARNLIRGDILTVAFTWCLAHYDREPHRFQGHNLIWEHQMVIGQLSNLHDVSRAKLEELLDDLARRVERAGLSLRRVHSTRRIIAPDLGDREMAKAATRDINRHPADPMCPTPMRERLEEIETDVFVGDDDHAISLAEPFLNDRHYDRSETDEVTSYLLLPLLRRGRVDELKTWAKRCERSFFPERHYYWSYGELVKAAALLGDMPRALRLFQRCQHGITSSTDPLTQLHFALDASVLFERLLRLGRREVSIRLPDLFAVPDHNGRFEVVSLRDYFAKQACELAALFDNRNGNGYFREQIDERMELQGLAVYS